MWVFLRRNMGWREIEYGFFDEFLEEDDLLGDKETKVVSTRLPIRCRLAYAAEVEAVFVETGKEGRMAQKGQNLSYMEAVTGSVGSVDKEGGVDCGGEVVGEGEPWQEVSYKRKRTSRPLLLEHLRGRSDVRLVGGRLFGSVMIAGLGACFEGL